MTAMADHPSASRRWAPRLVAAMLLGEAVYAAAVGLLFTVVAADFQQFDGRPVTAWVALSAVAGICAAAVLLAAAITVWRQRYRSRWGIAAMLGSIVVQVLIGVLALLELAGLGGGQRDVAFDLFVIAVTVTAGGGTAVLLRDRA